MKPVWLIVLLTAMLGAWSSLALAEEPETDLLYADPPGAYMAVRGPVSVSGAEPLPLSDLPLGEYSLTTDVPGLPAAKGRLL
ncbi:MAG: hypothetical protein KAY24_07405, partial [Candidatus Eisenbacteria sp.]|nr:hypothetical protein [Candidatus Eisenbacteria bacterium]